MGLGAFTQCRKYEDVFAWADRSNFASRYSQDTIIPAMSLSSYTETHSDPIPHRYLVAVLEHKRQRISESKSLG